MIPELIQSALILEDLGAVDKSGAIAEILDAGCQAGLFTKRQRTAFSKRLMEREKLGSTGIGNGVAVPHIKGKEVTAPWLILARSLGGVDYAAVDGRAVHLVFLLGMPLDQAEDHLHCLRWISGLARNADFRRFCAGAAGEQTIRDLLHEMSAGS